MPAQNEAQVKESRAAQEDGGNQALLRQLKGAPLSVLLALEIYGKQGRAELVDRTGWGEDAVADALAQLVEAGLVTRVHYRCWKLTPGVSVMSFLPPDSPTMAGAENGTSRVSTSESGFNRLSAESGPDPVSGAENGFSRTSGLENGSGRLSTPHDHDGVIDTKEHRNQDKHHPSKTTMKKLARALKSLDPPFENGRRWLQEASPQLVQAWLDYLQNLDRESRRRIRNEAAFLRWKVESKEEPPAPKRSAPCKRCNKAIRDAEGRCLVCLGLVTV